MYIVLWSAVIIDIVASDFPRRFFVLKCLKMGEFSKKKSCLGRIKILLKIFEKILHFAKIFAKMRMIL